MAKLKEPRELLKTKVIFIDEKNDLQSQIAEYFLDQLYGDRYEACSAGPSIECIDCELISVMYQEGYDIRPRRAKDFKAKLPKKLDYVVFLEKSTYDRISGIVPWKSPQIMKDFGRKENFSSATDDSELATCYKELISKVRAWVEETFKDPESLKAVSTPFKPAEGI
jgi:arsenate reductase